MGTDPPNSTENDAEEMLAFENSPMEDYESSIEEDRNFTVLDNVAEEEECVDESSEEEELDSEEILKLVDAGTQVVNLPSVPSSSSGNIISKKVIKYCEDINDSANLHNDWQEITHASGIPLYFHESTGVLTTSRPYLLGPGSLKKHKLQLNSVPCLAYSKFLEKKKNRDVMETETDREILSNEKYPNIPTETLNGPTDRQINASANRCPVEHSEIANYCKKLFKMKKINIRKFHSWKMKRAYVHKQKCQNKRNQGGSDSPNQTVLITVPIYNSNTKTMSTYEWSLNPAGKSSVCILHEYLQRAVKMKPTYKYKELEHALTPYQSTITLNGMIYGSGIGSSKKEAKLEAAKSTLEILIPQLKNTWSPKKKKAERFPSDADKYALFDNIKITDTRIAEFCTNSTELSPYTMLLTCLKTNFGISENMINLSVSLVENQVEFKMEVGKHSASVICKSKKEGKQLASQMILQALHPQVHFWGSLLRLYGNTIKGVQTKRTEDCLTEVQSIKRCKSPNWAILNELRNAMEPIYADREYLLIRGKSERPNDIKDLFPDKAQCAESNDLTQVHQATKFDELEAFSKAPENV